MLYINVLYNIYINKYYYLLRLETILRIDFTLTLKMTDFSH